MKIGFAQQCITPHLPVHLAGFAQERTAQSVLDDLFVKAVVYQRGETMYGVLAFDLIAVDNLLIDQIKEGMTKLPLKSEHILFAATHTHAGPGGIVETREGILKPAANIFITTDPQIIRFIAQKSIQALQEAIAGCRETTVSYAVSTLKDVGNNRNSRDFKGNDDILAVFLKQEEDRKAVILNFACHPTIMNGAHAKISADIPGAIAACMRPHGYEMSMYLNGSCGDISTRFSRKSCEESELMRYGQMFEEKLLEMEKGARQIHVDEFSIALKTYPLQIKQADSLQKAKEELAACEKRLQEARQKGVSGAELRVIESYKEGALSNLSLAQHPYKMTTYDIRIMFIKINRHIFVCVPGELFSELSNPLQNEQVHFIGYANGYVGYIADVFAYENYYYEALCSPFKKGQGEFMMSYIKQEISRMLGKEN